MYSRLCFEAVFLSVGVWAASFGLAQDAPTAVNHYDQKLVERWEQDVKPLLQKYCSECHGPESAEADVDVTRYQDLASVRSQPAIWDQIRGVVKIGAMPPDDSTQPSEEERIRLSDWVVDTLHRVDCGISQSPGHVTIRRLNNTEYDHTIRDLFDFDWKPSVVAGFVSDEVGNGFDNQGEVLSLPPLLLEKYLAAAEQIAEKAIVLDPESLRKQSQEGDALLVGETFSAEFHFAAGQYKVAARMRFGDGQDNSVVAKLLIDGQEIETWEVEPKSKSYSVDLDFTEGKHRVQVLFAEDPHTKELGKFERRIHVERIRIEGPEGASPPLPFSHRRVIVAMPSETKSVADAARENFAQFLRVAYRRPAEPLEVERLVTIVEQASQSGMSFAESMRYGLQAALVSPPFLFRIERSEGELVREGVRRLGSYEIATRLAYFLWSSTPDEILLDAAGTDALQRQDVVQFQIDRMLNDPRSEALVHGFFAQWLGLRNLNVVDVDGRKFAPWSDRLREAMRRETELFCKYLISPEGKLIDVLDADFTFVNPRMAELYGLEFEGKNPVDLYRADNGPGSRRQANRRNRPYIDEDKWIKASLPASRRGLLTQASILTLTSNPSRTSPVKRGKWVLENILGDPPPPAPPGVPALEETSKEHANTSLREQLEIHRSNPSCASWHRVMDPIGLGMENFDAIGQWREEDQGQPIQSGGELADGRTFTNATELLTALKADQPKIARHFAAKMLTYALGRGLNTSDQCAIDRIVEAAERDQYRIRAFVQAIAVSEPFTLQAVEAVEPQTPEIAESGANHE